MMQQKRNKWVYVVLSLMLFSLVIFSALPLVSSIVSGDRLSLSRDAELTTFSSQELVKMAAEASGYEKVLEREPENETALRGLLDIRIQQKDIAGAITPLEKLARLHKEQTEYTILLAQAKQQIEDYEGAASAYRQVLATKPGNILALGGITNLFLVQDLPERAIALLKNTIKTATNNKGAGIDLESVELLLGELYTTQERYGEALSLYDRVAAANEDDFRPVLAKALVLEKQGEVEAAKPILDSAYTLAPAEYKDQIGREMERLGATSEE